MKKLETDHKPDYSTPKEDSDFEFQQSKLLSVAAKARKSEERILNKLLESSDKAKNVLEAHEATVADRIIAKKQSECVILKEA